MATRTQLYEPDIWARCVCHLWVRLYVLDILVSPQDDLCIWMSVMVICSSNLICLQHPVNRETWYSNALPIYRPGVGAKWRENILHSYVVQLYEPSQHCDVVAAAQVVTNESVMSPMVKLNSPQMVGCRNSYLYFKHFRRVFGVRLYFAELDLCQMEMGGQSLFPNFQLGRPEWSKCNSVKFPNCVWAMLYPQLGKAQSGF